MKLDLQLRAEELSARFKVNQRKPIIVEFAGVPKSGKTTILTTVNSFLKRCGFRPEIVVERASICPIRDKKHCTFNVWTACTTLSQILEKTQEPPRDIDPNILILVRGLFDSICWLELMDKTAGILRNEKDAIEHFILLDEWKKRVNLVVFMTVDPEEALKREAGVLKVEGSQGSIMNKDILKLMLDTSRETSAKLKSEFNIFEVDTSKSAIEETAKAVMAKILDVIEDQIKEEILCLPKSIIASVFNDSVSIDSVKAKQLIQLFQSQGRFIPREEIEKDSSSIQAIPIVVIRNRRGDVLQLRRKERAEDNPLNEKLVLWAGGHVRKEDDRKEDDLNGNSITNCLRREVREELRISLLDKDLRLLGAIYSDFGKKTSKHVALVFEWRTDKDDINIALCTAEFFERRGTSLSGKFVDLTILQKQASDPNQEVWSQAIILTFLQGNGQLGQSNLFLPS